MVRLGQTVDIGVTPVLRGKYDDFFWSTYIMDGIRRGAMQHAVKLLQPQPRPFGRARSDDGEIGYGRLPIVVGFVRL